MTTEWAKIEAAIVSWLAGSTGIPTAKFYWANPRKPDLPRPFVRLHRKNWKGQSAEFNYSTDANRPRGSEVQIFNVFRGTFDVGVQVMAGAVSGDLQQTVSCAADRTALDYLVRACAALEFPGTSDAFNAVGMSCLAYGDIIELPESKEAVWASRATVDVTFFASFSAEERVGYIERVTGEGLVRDYEGQPDGDAFPVPFDFMLPP